MDSMSVIMRNNAFVNRITQNPYSFREHREFEIEFKLQQAYYSHDMICDCYFSGVDLIDLIQEVSKVQLFSCGVKAHVKRKHYNKKRYRKSERTVSA